MNRTELEAAKRNGTVLALRRERHSLGRREIGVHIPAVPVKVTAVHARTRAHGKGSTGCEVILVTEGVEEIVSPVEDRDEPTEFGHVVDGVPHRVTSHYDRDTRETTHTPTDEPATFPAIDFLMPWDQYAPNRNRWLERKREQARERADTQADLDRRYGIIERALGHIPIAFNRGHRSVWIEGERGRRVQRVSTVEIDLDVAEKLAEWIEGHFLPDGADLIAAFVAAVVRDEPHKGLADFTKDEILGYAERAERALA